MFAVAGFQIFVDAYQVQFVISGHQNERYNQVTQEIPQYHQHIGKHSVIYPPRNAHKGNSRQACANHSVGNDSPRRFSVTLKEGFTVRTVRSDVSNSE